MESDCLDDKKTTHEKNLNLHNSYTHKKSCFAWSGTEVITGRIIMITAASAPVIAYSVSS